MSKPILVAVDGSDEAGAAFDVGLDLAVARAAPVAALHVAPATEERLFKTEARDSLSREQILASDPMLAELATLAERRGVTVDFHLSGGTATDFATDHPRPADVVPAILGHADALDAQLIVLGSRGQHGLARALGGSTSEAVMRAAARPVLVVHI